MSRNASGVLSVDSQNALDTEASSVSHMSISHEDASYGSITRDLNTPCVDDSNTPRPFKRARKIVLGAVFVSVVASLIWHTGTGTLSALGISSIAAVCPLGSLETLLTGHDGFLLHPFALLAFAVVLALVFGKAFCAWLCPTSYIQRFFHPKKVEAEIFEAEDVAAERAQVTDVSNRALAAVGGKRDGVHIDGRHIVLGGALVSAFVFGFPVFCLVCPVGLTFATVIGIWNLIAYNEVTWMLVVVPVVLVLELVVFRKWCTTLCPISALISLISVGNRSFKPQVEHNKCLRSEGVDCRACVQHCPEQVDPHTAHIPECSKCGVCIEGCPAHAIKMKFLVFTNKTS